MRHLSWVVLAVLYASSAHAEDWDFLLTNSTGKPIKTVELAPAGSTHYDPATGDPVIRPEASITARFERPVGHCLFDLRATFEDATTEVVYKVNVCSSSHITLKLTGGKLSITSD